VPDWTAFGAITVVLTLLVLFLARTTQRALDSSTEPAETLDQPEDVEEISPQRPDRGKGISLDDISTAALLANVVGTQLLFLVLLLGGIWYADVPLGTLGVTMPTGAELGIGAVLGTVLFGLNQVAARLGRQFGLGGEDAANRAGAAGNEELREALAPDSLTGWLVLLFVVLPVVAGFEELLFRGALVGGLATGFGLSPWLLVAGSSLAFGLGHGAQGRVGIAVTAMLGGVLGAAFVATGSLWLVVVAHYLVNALEFVVCEGVRE